MNIHDNQQLDLESAQRVQERVQFYFVTLTFTLLALSVQTAKFTGSNVSSASELLAWLFLLLSGITGLGRLNSLAGNFKISIHQHSIQSNIDSTVQLIKDGNQTILLQNTGEAVNAKEYLEQQLQTKTNFETKETTLSKKQWFLMRIHQLALMLGLVLLIISRGIDHAYALVT
jgi:hypothetical protein